MKAMVCELCGSNDIVKQDGLYVCQHCGTKYSLEEAKKIMVEIDITKKLANIYERARKSIEVNDLAHAAEYYKEILDENPDDWEAYFYSYLGEFPTFTNAEAGSVAAKLGNTIPPAYDMAIKDCAMEEVNKRFEIITRGITDRLTSIARTGESLLRQYEGGGFISAAGRVNQNLYANIRPTVANTFANCVAAFSNIAEKLESILNSDNQLDKELIKKHLLTIRQAQYELANTTFYRCVDVGEQLIKEEVILDIASKIKELDPSTTIPTESSTAKSSSSGGCYVATAVYGSYDCPQVWTLRRFRDYTLAETWYGRAFIHTYYAVSPTLVKWFGKTEWFKNLWKPTLDKMVSRLNSRGVADTPYQDRNW